MAETVNFQKKILTDCGQTASTATKLKINALFCTIGFDRQA